VKKKFVLSSFLNMAGLAAARMSGGSEFHAAGPACEKARSPNLARSRGVTVTYLLLEADRRPVRVAVLLDVRMMSLRYAGHLPVCTAYMIVHSLKPQSIIWKGRREAQGRIQRDRGVMPPNRRLSGFFTEKNRLCWD